MSRKPKLYIDFDNTIVNSVKSLVACYNQDFLYYDEYKEVRWVDVNSYDLKECNCATKEQILEYFNQYRFFLYLDCMKDAKEILDELKDYYDIYIVTLGTSANLKGKKIWLKRNIPYATLIDINMGKYQDKSHLDLSDGILIDDVPEYLETSNARIKVCFGCYSWNKEWNGLRCYNWEDVKNYLLKN